MGPTCVCCFPPLTWVYTCLQKGLPTSWTPSFPSDSPCILSPDLSPENQIHCVHPQLGNLQWLHSTTIQ